MVERREEHQLVAILDAVSLETTFDDLAQRTPGIDSFDCKLVNGVESMERNKLFPIDKRDSPAQGIL